MAERVGDERAAPAAALTVFGCLDAEFQATGDAVGRGDQAAFVAKHLHVAAQLASVADSRMGVEVVAFGQARRAACAAADEEGVDDADAAVFAQPGQDARVKSAAEAVGAPSKGVVAGDAGGDDRVAGE